MEANDFCSAAYHGDLETMMGMRVDVRAKNKDGMNAMYLACWQGHLHVVRWLYENGAAEDLMTTNVQGLTVLDVARLFNQRELHRWLLMTG